MYILLPAYAISLCSCMCSKTDSKRVAMKENKSKLEKKQLCDANFAVCAAEGSLMEIKLSELAQTNASSAKVKEFSKTMFDDHSASNMKLRKIADEKKISLPGKLSDKSQKNYDSFTKKTGKDFDKAYIRCMVKDHKHDICAFEREAKKGKDADLKKWASEEVPVLKRHLEMAKSTCSEVSKSK